MMHACSSFEEIFMQAFHVKLAQQRFQHALMAMAAAALGLAIAFPLFADVLPHIPTSGHSHVHAHGHPFIDARTLWGIPNALDVLSNVPFLFAGIWGWVVLHGKALAQPLKRAAQVFFLGLILTCFGSAYYHWLPDSFGLMVDRIGMAVAFAGVISLAAGSRLGAEASRQALPLLLPLALLAAVAAHTLNNILPWVIVQFGGIAVVLWLAYLPKGEAFAALPLKLFALIGWYALAKVLEANDEAVFHATQGWVSGHSLKHLAACMAAWPVMAAIRGLPKS
jgi:hypothetical protein